ncbi:MAG: protein translocase subunit SecD [Bdellovibrionaceae bacterium]|nr:protein translocase subunit SecD [Pseudobdellovibrionaceae bacterium]
MIESLRARLIISLIVSLIGIVWVIPNFVDTSKMWWPTKDKLVYGLDIQGGLHLSLGVDVKTAMRDQTNKQVTSLKAGLKTEKAMDADIEIVDPSKVHLKIKFTGDVKAVEDYLDTYQRTALQVLSSAPGVVEVQYYDSYLAQFMKNLVEKAREVIANRIDEFGVAEPSITVQGEDRIIVQLPGLVDSEGAKKLINRTAKLEFMILDQTVNMEELRTWIADAEKEGKFALGQEDLRYSAYIEKLNEALKTKLPKNTVVRFQKGENAKNLETEKLPFVLKTDSMMLGDTLDNAYTGQDPQTGQPIVNFQFNDRGAKEFGELTTVNKGGYMAIVLDGVVQSAPYLKTAILGGSGYIDMNRGTYDQILSEANYLSMVLRSGALPVNLELLEERVVGPSLGADSVMQGKRATVFATLFVFLFMIAYYRMFGFIADIAVAANMVLLFAVLSSLKATITLPGIAGIALTIGMSVDANIIIFERVRDELRRGSSIVAATRDGFARAFWAIFDSNITTAGTCLILMYYGSGPIRGFAVSLVIGLAISMFTAIFMVRALLELFLVKLKLKINL